MSDGLGGTTPMVPGALSVVGEPVVAGGGADEAARLVGVWGRAEVEAGRPKRLWGCWGVSGCRLLASRQDSSTWSIRRCSGLCLRRSTSRSRVCDFLGELGIESAMGNEEEEEEFMRTESWPQSKVGARIRLRLLNVSPNAIHSFGPVSYTHLDVYKRQVYISV